MIRFNDDVMLLKVEEKDCFVFSFGCLVCWGCTPQEANAARAYVENHLVKPLEPSKIEVDFLSIRGYSGELPLATKACGENTASPEPSSIFNLLLWSHV